MLDSITFSSGILATCVDVSLFVLAARCIVYNQNPKFDVRLLRNLKVKYIRFKHETGKMALKITQGNRQWHNSTGHIPLHY